MNRLYSVRIKVIPNGNGFMQTYDMNKIRVNQILFHHNCVIKVNYEALQESDYDDDLVVFLYGEKDKLDEMAKKAYGTNKLYARKNVLKQ